MVLGCFKPTTYLQLETSFTHTPNHWMPTRTSTKSVLNSWDAPTARICASFAHLVRLVQCFRERRESSSVRKHLAITCVGWSPERTPWQATNTRHEHLASQLVRVLLQTHITWTSVFCVSEEEPSARRGDKGNRASHWLGAGAHDGINQELADFELCCNVTGDVRRHRMKSRARYAQHACQKLDNLLRE